MKKDKKIDLVELANKLGIKEENFRHGMKENPKALEASILNVSKFMGLIE